MNATPRSADAPVKGGKPVENGNGWTKWALALVTSMLLMFVGGFIGAQSQAVQVEALRKQLDSTRTSADANTIRLQTVERDYAAIRQELRDLNQKIDRLIEAGR